MIVDTSALAAVLLGEPDGDDLTRVMLQADSVLVSAANYLELAMVFDNRLGPAARERLDRVLRALGVEVVAFTPPQARLAREAHRRYGRGSGHPARLNFGDCMAYASAADTGEPLLWMGDDFGHTDLVSARETPPKA